MSTPTLSAIQKSLEDAGIEIYRAREDEIEVAERVRFHIMDSGVRVTLGDGSPRVRFTARSQRSDFPNLPEDELFALVRSTVGEPACGRGYVEASSGVLKVKNPVDDNEVLDVWHEITYEKTAQDLVDEVRWALEVEKYVASS